MGPPRHFRPVHHINRGWVSPPRSLFILSRVSPALSSIFSPPSLRFFPAIPYDPFFCPFRRSAPRKLLRGELFPDLPYFGYLQSPRAIITWIYIPSPSFFVFIALPPFCWFFVILLLSRPTAAQTRPPFQSPPYSGGALLAEISKRRS